MTSTCNTVLTMFGVHRILAAFRRGRGPATAFERGVVALDAGDHEAAALEFEAALDAATDDPARATIYNKLGVARMALGRRDDALEAFCAALELDEHCAPALVNVGNLFLEDGHPLDAIDYYQAALRADDSYPPAYRHLGIALRRLGRRAEAVRALRAADRNAGRPRRSHA
jgi:tetratricopeptide (TPR) repeat protein